MPNNIPGQIISELGEIGKKVGGEVAKIPKDIAGSAMESVGATTAANPSSAWERIDTETDEGVRRKMARAALKEFRKGEIKRTREPSIWEKFQMENEQKKEQSDKQQAAASSQLPMPTSKPKAGFGMSAKKTQAENKTIRQD